jgi:predicted thioesterase
MLELLIGTTATAQLTVGKLDLASAISPDGRDAFPDVLATARLVALMEIAAGRVLAPLLGVGELSVATTAARSGAARIAAPSSTGNG